MKFEKLSSELREMIAGKSPEELRALAKEMGHNLSNKELEGIAGGWDGGLSYYVKCPNCSESIRPDEIWYPECGVWLGEGPEPDFAPAREA